MRDFRLLQRCKWDLFPFWDVTWRRLAVRYRRFGTTYCGHYFGYTCQAVGAGLPSKQVASVEESNGGVRKCKLYWNFYIHNPQNTAKKIFSMHLKRITLWNSAQGEITDINKTKQEIKFLSLFYNRKGCDSSVGMATWRELNGPEVKSPVRTIFSALVQTGLGAHPAPFTVGTASLYREWRGRGVHHSPPSNAEVKERIDLYLYSPSDPHGLF